MGTRASRSTEGARQNSHPVSAPRARPELDGDAHNASMLTMAVGQSDDLDPGGRSRTPSGSAGRSSAGIPPAAALLFAAFDAFDPVMIRRVRAEFPGVQVVGCTSAAEMSSAGGYLEDSVTLALLAADGVDFTTAATTIET